MGWIRLNYRDVPANSPNEAVTTCCRRFARITAMMMMMFESINMKKKKTVTNVAEKISDFLRIFSKFVRFEHIILNLSKMIVIFELVPSNLKSNWLNHPDFFSLSSHPFESPRASQWLLSMSFPVCPPRVTTLGCTPRMCSSGPGIQFVASDAPPGTLRDGSFARVVQQRNGGSNLVRFAGCWEWLERGFCFKERD